MQVFSNVTEMISAFLHMLLCVGAVKAALPWPPHFSRWVWGTSYVAGDWLYLDGGEVYNLTSDNHRYFHILGSTLAIDLTKSWTNESVTAVAVDKTHSNDPTGFPFSRGPWVWEGNGEFSYWGGWTYLDDLCYGTWYNDGYGVPCSNETWLANEGVITEIDNTRLQEKLWLLDAPPRNGSGVWAASALQPPSDIGIGVGYMTASSDDTAFALGGADFLWQSFPSAIALPGLAGQDLAIGQWSNQTSQGYGASGKLMCNICKTESGLMQ